MELGTALIICVVLILCWPLVLFLGTLFIGACVAAMAFAATGAIIVCEWVHNMWTKVTGK